MIVLAIDTCGPTGSVALGNIAGTAVSLLTQTELAGKTYSSQIVPAVRRLLASKGLNAGAVEAIVVVNGPGSFTGVRIGVSSAKGFAEALRIPLLAASRLAVLAWKAEAQRAALDAGRGEFYFRDGSHEALVASKGLLLPDARPVAVCEPSAQRAFPEAILVEAPTAGDALNFAAPQLLAGDFADVGALDGNYVRRSDAEIFAKTIGKA
jgi:tRNA threonylcarbamoyladenosine biosynthesis protein TsaB